MSENVRLRPVIVETRRGVETFERIRETLGRLELTDGLTLAQLIVEGASRMPRDASVIAILGDVTTESAVALGNLRRSGYAVTAIVILSAGETQFGQDTGARFRDADGMLDKIGRLYAEGVDVRHIDNEVAISQLCSRQLVGKF